MKVGVAAPVADTGSEGGHRQIPADHNRNLEALPRIETDPHRQRSAGLFSSTTGPVVVAVGNASFSSKGLPQFRPITGGIPATAAHHLHILKIIRQRQAPLPFPLGERLGPGTIQQHTLEARLIHPTVALPFPGTDRRGVVVFGTAVVAEMHFGGWIGVGEPADGVTPAQQQRELQGTVAGIAQGPAEDGNGVAAALVVTGENWAEGLTTHLSRKHPGVAGPAQGVSSCVGSGGGVVGAGWVPLPGRERILAIDPGVITIRSRCQGMGSGVGAIALPHGELAIGDRAVPVLAAVEMPQIEVSARAATDAARTKTSEGHAMPGTIVEIAGVADAVGIPPAQPERTTPARLGSRPGLGAGSAAQQAAQSGQSQRSHESAESRPRLPDLNGSASVLLGIQQGVERDSRAHQRLIVLQRAPVLIQPTCRFLRASLPRQGLIHQRQSFLAGDQSQQQVVQTLTPLRVHW